MANASKVVKVKEEVTPKVVTKSESKVVEKVVITGTGDGYLEKDKDYSIPITSANHLIDKGHAVLKKQS